MNKFVKEKLNRVFSNMAAGVDWSSEGEASLDLVKALKDARLELNFPLAEDKYIFISSCESLLRKAKNSNNDLSDKFQEKVRSEEVFENLDVYFEFLISNWEELKNYTYTYRGLASLVRLSSDESFKKNQQLLEYVF